jgi:hypothetical protein
MTTTESADALAQVTLPFSAGNAPREVPSRPLRLAPRLVQGGAVGTLAGLAGVVAMTATMEAYYRLLPVDERWPLEPSLIVRRVTPPTLRASGRDGRGERRHTLLTLAAHVGYGATSGAAYALTLGKTPLPTPLKGVVFGLGLFAVGYLGWLPTAGILRPATAFPARRNAGLIAAHLIYGCVTALVTGALTRNDQDA